MNVEVVYTYQRRSKQNCRKTSVCLCHQSETTIVWVHNKLCNNKHILYGVFYRPPNSQLAYNSLTEDSVSLAIDTNISDFIITGDFNRNQLNSGHCNTVNSLCTQFGLSQCIQEPTHFTEISSSILDLVLVTNKNSVLVTGVGEPCLDSHVRCHYPVFAVLNIFKPRHKSIQRAIWKYDEGNYDNFRIELNNFDWDTLVCDDIDIHVNNFTKTLSQIASLFIPNKRVTEKPYEPPWLTKEIKK